MSTSSRKCRSSVKKRLIEFPNKCFSERGNEMWCKPCNVKLDYIKKSSINQHLDTATHKKLSELMSSNRRSLNFDAEKDDRNKIKNDFRKDLMVAFACSNIPVDKLNNKVLQKCISKYLKNEVADAWPSTTHIRKNLKHIHEDETEKLRSTLQKKKVAIFADETTDSEQRDVLNILVLELDAFKHCKPLLCETYFLNVNQ